VSSVDGDIRWTAQKASTGGKGWLERGARLGYAARGLLYAIIAVTSLSLALGTGGETQGSEGALHTLAGQPYGSVLLWVVTVGLAGYALWRLVQVFTNHEDNLAKSLWMRAYYAIRAVLYGLLAWTAFGIVSNAGSSGGGGSDRKTLVAKGLELPGGRWIVAGVGLAIVGYGLWQWYRVATKRWEDKMKPMSGGVKTLVDTAGIVGYLGRGVVFGVIGGYLVQAGLNAEPDKAMGLDGALSALAGAGYGPWLLGVVAIGLLGFSVFSFAESKYRRIET
jgi:uncharacterized membrane protein YidH (DUF202 family)